LRPREKYRLGPVDGPEAQKRNRGALEYTREDGTPLPLTPDISRRRFDYDRRLLPNPYMTVPEPQELDRPTRHQGLTIGYPAWRLLYYNYEHVAGEIEIVHPLVARGRGKIYFDNTMAGGVAEALRFLRRAYGGNVVEFENCSWRPPGNAIWQPD
jgi:hypothetical protein